MSSTFTPTASCSASPFGFPPRVSMVKKRDGAEVPFQLERIVRAIALAKYESLFGEESPHRGDAESRYGLHAEDFARCRSIADTVQAQATDVFGAGATPSVEHIQDLVEVALLQASEIAAVRAYISYRTRHAELRPVRHGANGMSEYIAQSRYLRFDPKLGRREVWAEGVGRVRDMHLARFAARLTNEAGIARIIDRLVNDGVIARETLVDVGRFRDLASEIRTAFEMVEQKRVLPSMRSLQFGGLAIERENSRMFNCSFTNANRVEFFRQYFHLLLCGCGVGFSVQRHHVAKLPPFAPRPSEIELPVEHFAIADSIEGWADALGKLIDSYIHGYKVELGYHQIRRRGALLRTSGGRAPGHLPLKRAMDKVGAILDRAVGRQMRPIEVYDICMHVAKAVLSGGIRRSATICLFSPDDDEMMAAKTGNWCEENEQRSASNNSAVLIRGEVTRPQFDKLFACQKDYGEPGFFFAESRDVGCNPCAEISLNPELVVTEKTRDRLIEYGYTEPLEIGQTVSGVQMCNVTTINGRTANTPDRFFEQVRHAALIGTLQADYTHMPYLGPVTRVLNEREALIGVSICGILDNPGILLNADMLRRAADVVKATNAIVAAAIGINRAARTTTVKPEGTASLVFGCSSGIGPHHARRYFRRVQGSRADPVLRHFKSINPHMVELSVHDKHGGTDVITFPVEGPENAIYREDLTALRHLEYVRDVQSAWVMNGRAYTTYTDAHHNVSNTISVAEDEWDQVADFIWENRHVFTGVALLRADGDKTYAQAPRESVVTTEDVRRWNSLVYRPVDYALIPDKEDETAGAEHRSLGTACAGGRCEI